MARTRNRGCHFRRSFARYIHGYCYQFLFYIHYWISSSFNYNQQSSVFPCNKRRIWRSSSISPHVCCIPFQIFFFFLTVFEQKVETFASFVPLIISTSVSLLLLFMILENWTSSRNVKLRLSPRWMSVVHTAISFKYFKCLQNWF